MRSHIKFAVMNIGTAVLLVLFGSLMMYLGRNDPPEGGLGKLVALFLFVLCPIIALVTAKVLLASDETRFATAMVTLNYCVCVLGFLYALFSALSFGLNYPFLVGAAVLFLPFALNIHALHEHRADPTGERRGNYAKKK